MALPKKRRSRARSIGVALGTAAVLTTGACATTDGTPDVSFDASTASDSNAARDTGDATVDARPDAGFDAAMAADTGGIADAGAMIDGALGDAYDAATDATLVDLDSEADSDVDSGDGGADGGEGGMPDAEMS